jgi:hypothetical protein
MRNQEQRDKVTVEIVMTLVVFSLVAAVGALTLVLLDQALGIQDGLLDALAYTVWGCAFVVGARHLWRHRRP